LILHPSIIHRHDHFLFWGIFLGLSVVGLKTDLQNPVAQGVPVQGLDGHQALVVVGHSDKTKAFALIGLQVADDLDVLHGAEWAEQLPKDVLLRLGG
jgi:hypothetical protein